MSEARIERLLSDLSELRSYIFINVDKLQSAVQQSELSTKGALNSLEFRLEAILQANLDTFWLLMCSILVFLNASWIYVFGVWFNKKKKQH